MSSTKIFFTKSQFADNLLHHMTSTYMRGPYDKAFRRSVITKKSLYFESSIHYAEDYLFNLQFIETANTIQFVEESTYLYYLPPCEKVYRMDSDEFYKCTNKIIKCLKEIFSNTAYRSRLKSEFSINKTLNFGQFYNTLKQMPYASRLKEILRFLLLARWTLCDGNLIGLLKHAAEIAKLAIV